MTQPSSGELQDRAGHEHSCSVPGWGAEVEDTEASPAFGEFGGRVIGSCPLCARPVRAPGRLCCWDRPAGSPAQKALPLRLRPPHSLQEFIQREALQ